MLPSRFPARGFFAGLIVCSVAAAPASPAVADWLVLEDGSRLETEGEWEVKGNVLVFTLARGPLSSLPLSQVDLGASEDLKRRLEEQAQAPKAETEAPKRKAALVLTDKDVRHVTPRSRSGGAAGGGEGDGGGDAESEAAAADRARQPGDGVQVTSWDVVEDERVPGVVIEGELRNTGAAVAIRVQLTVVLRDLDGSLLATADALLGATTLAHRRRTRFRAEFPGIFSYGAAEFQLEHGDGALEGARPTPEA